MSTQAVYTALNIPTVISSPSVNCFQWSPDGQACFTSKSAVYIMTPDHGINFDTESTLKASSHEESEDRPLLAWFRTMIQFNTSEVCRWPDYSQEFGAGALGSIDVTIWAMAFSPSNITPDAGCIMATLSTNMDLTLWSAGKNTLKGEWMKVFDVTPFLIQTFLKDETKTRTESTLTAQLICIAWSRQADFGLEPTPTTLNASLLVSGNRAGCLVFMRYNRNHDADSLLEIVQLLEVSDKWITHVAFSRWELVEGEERTCTAYVAYGTSDGVVDIVKVKQKLHIGGMGFSFHIVTTVEHDASAVIGETRKAGFTAMEWVDMEGRKPILVYCKPGTIHLWSPPPSPPSSSQWSGDRIFTLKTQKHSVGSSSLHPITGLQYIPRRDDMVVCLLDGSFHVVRTLSREPSMSTAAESTTEVSMVDVGTGEDIVMETDDQTQVIPPPENQIASASALPTISTATTAATLPTTSASASTLQTTTNATKSLVLTPQILSSTVRSVFSRVESDTITFHDVNRTSGMVSYDNMGVLGWVHESCRPADFSYKHDAKHNSMLIVARIWNGMDDDILMEDTSKALFSSRTSSGLGPLQILRPTFFHLRARSTLNRVHGRLLELLRTSSEDHSIGIILPSWTQAQISLPSPLSEGMRAEFRTSLASHLFGWDVLLSLRMRLAVADFVWKLSNNPERQSECGRVAQSLLLTISHRNLRTIIRHLVAVADRFTLDDIPFVRRMVVQSLLDGSPADLSSEGKALSDVVSKLFEGQDQDHSATASYQNLNEHCPACQIEVPFENITNAVCANGHMWSRCSVTTFILSTPRVRTCIGCTRKAFLPLSTIPGRSAEDRNSLPPGARGWFVDDLLEAVHRCLFCGNSFVSVL